MVSPVLPLTSATSPPAPHDPSALSQPVPQLLQRHPLLFYLGVFPKAFCLGLSSLLLTNALDSITPLFIKAGIDHLTNGHVGRELGLVCALLLLSNFFTAIFRYLWRMGFGNFNHLIAEDLRGRIFNKLTELGPNFFSRRPVGDLMSLITNDVNSVRMQLGPGVLILFDAAFIFSMIIPLMISLSWSWTWKALILLPFVPLLISKIERAIYSRYKVRQALFSRLSGASQEIISGISVIKGYSQQQNQTRLYDQQSDQFRVASDEVAWTESIFQPTLESAVTIGIVLLLWYGSSDVMSGGATLGTFVAFHQYVRKMIWPMTAIGIGVTLMEEGRASFARITEIFRQETDMPVHGNRPLESFISLEIKNLSFSYPHPESHSHSKNPPHPENPRQVLKSVNLEILAGQTIAIVGPVGSGKSTLMHIIAGLLPVPSESILINGNSLETIRVRDLRAAISLVPQDAFLFSDTITSNIAFGLGGRIFDEKIQQWSSAVQMTDEIKKMPKQWESIVGERGVTLSGGQKQRLTIARSLICDSPVLILDDSLNAVDNHTEKLILERLKSESHAKNQILRTTLLVSHRISSLQHAHTIYVLNEGRIESFGTHEELLLLSPTYRNLVNEQGREITC